MAFAGIKSEQQRQDDLVAGPSLVASNLNFKYKLEPKGAYSWTPVRVFDDGVKTYIEMNPDMKRSEAPAFFIREKKELNLVNYRMRGDYIVVDRLFDQGELRSGEKDLVLISREQKHWWRSN
jgi:type IV secretion system protein VirB9